ncbi:MAG: hypothetical protein WC548_04345, partial [Candidatus Pacearchaeota archaeon]
MSYKRVVEKRGKSYGPYIYESYRDKDGKVKKRYLGKVESKKKIYGFLFFIFAVFLFSLIVGVGYSTIFHDNFDEFSNSFFEGSIKSITEFFLGLTGHSISENSLDADSDESVSVVSADLEGSTSSEFVEVEVVSETSEESLIVEDKDIENLEGEDLVFVENETVDEEIVLEDLQNKSDFAGTDNETESVGSQNISDFMGNETMGNFSEDVTNESENSLGELNLSLNETGLVLSNVSVDNSTGFNVSTYNTKIVIGKPVKWVKSFTVNKNENIDVKIKIPKNAENISIKTEDEAGKAIEELEDVNVVATGEVVGLISERGLISRFISWVKSLTISGRVVGESELEGKIKEVGDRKEVDVSEIIEKSKDEKIDVAIEYYTEAPVSFEEEIVNGKRIIISASDELGYSDVVAYSVLDDEISLDKIRLYHLVGKEKVSFDFESYDIDGDGNANMIEWVVSHLSNQTYEIIYITNAQHLDENREFIEDVFGLVNKVDGEYALIPSGDYIRVTFEYNLTSDRDITIYARANNSQVEVYTENGEDLIAVFENITEGRYTIFLGELVGSEDVFDLRSVGDVEYDFVIDPYECTGTATSCSTYSTEGGCEGQLGCEWSYCSGGTVSCSSGTQYSCEGWGCVWDGCTGTAENCNVHMSQSSCEDDYCTWIGSECTDGETLSCTSRDDYNCEYNPGCTWGGGCEGTIDCSNLNFQSTCSSWGCTWYGSNPVEGCDGTADPCSSLDETDCNSQDGCSWSYVSHEPTLYMTFNPTSPRTYGTAINASCRTGGGSGYGTLSMWRNGVDVTSQNNIFVTIPAGSHFYSCNVTEGSYYDAGSWTNTFTMNKATPAFSTSVTTPINYKTASNYAGSESNSGDGGCTYTLKRGSTTIDTGSSVSDNSVLAAGTYTYNYSTSGCTNYTHGYNTRSLTVNKISPAGSLTSSGGWSITAGTEVTIGLSESNTGDGDVSYVVYRNGTNKGTGETWTPSAGTYIYVLNTTGGTNYSANSNMDSEVLVVSSSPDTTSPTYSNAGSNNSYVGLSTNFSILWNDDSALNSNGQWIFSTNNSGTWANDSAVNFTSTPSWANAVKTLNSTVGISIGYRWYARDNAGNWNVTPVYVLTTTSLDDTTSPTYSGASHNTTLSGTSIEFSLDVNDDLALNNNGQWIFSTNNSGTWTNNSAVNFTTTPEGVSAVKTLNSTVGISIGYRWYLTDNAGNWNVTVVYNLITSQESEAGLVALFFISPPTPSDGVATINSYVEMNTSISAGNISEVKWNWNGTNYTLYNNSLVLMYNFENRSLLGENSTKVVDASGGGNNGSVVGATWTSSGKHGGGYSFDGSGNYIGMGTNKFDYEDITVCAWFKGTYTGAHRIVTSGNENTNDWIFSVFNGYLYISSSSASHSTRRSDSTLSNDVWYF